MRFIVARTLACIVGVIGLLAIGSPLAVSAVNNFQIQHYQIDYYLGRDAQHRSTLKTTERIEASFPATDQNHGLERAIPHRYDGHSTSLKVESVTNGANQPLDYTTYTDGDNTVLRIGREDTYAHGRQVYTITYTQRDVTKYFADTKDDEFYWDTNGTDWRVPIEDLSVNLHVDSSLVTTLTRKQQCYKGRAGATATCELLANQNSFVSDGHKLQPGENVTIALGFQPQTFASYQPSLGERLVQYWLWLLVLSLPIALGLLIWIVVRYYRRSNRVAELRTIVPEYLPPKHASVSTSARIFGVHGQIFGAQLVDLAVRHYLRIYQTREKSLFRQPNYELAIIKDIGSLRAEERELLEDLFDEPKVGARLDMQTLKRNRKVIAGLMDNKSKLDTSITGAYGLRARDTKQSAWFKRMAWIVAGLSVLLLSPWLLAVAITSLVLSFTLRPLTDAGLELSRDLKGLRMYIGLAEAERLRILQSPEGAAKVAAPIDTNDKRQLIKLYERLLPYAMLFGQEKGWNKQLGQYYQDAHQVPTWYSGHTAFNAILFSTAMHNFSQVASYSDPASSASGGSSGGGLSGGGGGGGGGGGW